MSTLKVNTIEEATSGGATYFTAKAWVNFNGTGTVAIRADGNVSSMVDYGTGLFGYNLQNAASDANGASVATFTQTINPVDSFGLVGTATITSSLVQLSAYNTFSNGWIDAPYFNGVFIR
ncbi:hypothetical protein N9796_00370 [bacterium]|nr:hypothetical protein [bacterium]MDB4277778.1 hypothetical protein [Gammaproteobacteria bacterium]MDB4352541.1 hypothetical protein [Porticoccaceae bacterium]